MKKINCHLHRIFHFLILISSLHLFGQSIATYDITFTSIWNATDHTSIPNNAHWSDLVGATHKNINEFLELGTNATLGIQFVAELGNNTNFNNEVNAAITANNAEQWLQQGFSPFAAISSATLSNVEITEEHHYLTLVAMIAPSPDWFIAINSLDLRTVANDGWKDSFSIDVFAYDAGTDDGTNYDSVDMASMPFVPISMISGFPINGNKMGTLTVTLKSVLGVHDVDILDQIQLIPNPSEGKVRLANILRTKIKTLEVYNILGRQIESVEIPQGINNLNLNFDALQNGLYLLKFKNLDGLSTTKKLIIE